MTFYTRGLALDSRHPRFIPLRIADRHRPRSLSRCVEQTDRPRREAPSSTCQCEARRIREMSWLYGAHRWRAPCTGISLVFQHWRLFVVSVSFFNCEERERVAPVATAEPPSGAFEPAPVPGLKLKIVPPRPSRFGPCPGDEMKECVGRYTTGSLSAYDIRALVHEAIPECFAVRDYSKLAKQSACLPLDVGVDESNGRLVQLRYHCSDVCPDQGQVAVLYVGVSWSDCCDLGGSPSFDPARGRYRGCSPERPEESVFWRFCQRETIAFR
jgi:hypothetical protein